MALPIFKEGYQNNPYNSEAVNISEDRKGDKCASFKVTLYLEKIDIKL